MAKRFQLGILMVLVFILGALTIGGLSMAQQTPTLSSPDGILFLNKTGRFQFFQSKTPFTQIDENRTENVSLLFKIDTQTGDAWMFQGSVGKNKTMAQWHPIKTP